jgi:hypothetical protein
MKDIHWFLVMCIAGASVMLWLARMSARMSVARRFARDKANKPKGIWTRDIFDNRFGHAAGRVASIVMPSLLMGWGLLEVLTGEARFKRFSYRGFDAVCIGVATASIGIALLALVTFPAHDAKGDRVRSRISLAAGLLVVAGFATAFLRNV